MLHYVTGLSNMLHYVFIIITLWYTVFSKNVNILKKKINIKKDIASAGAWKWFKPYFLCQYT